MPLHWTVDHDQKLLLTEAVGDITLAEVAAYLDAVVKAGTMSYRKLFDGSQASTAMTNEEMMTIGIQLRTYHGQGRIGALAVVVLAEKTPDLARLFGALAAADRPIRLFGTAKAARRWLDQQPR